jgi:hypothetical protein
LLNLLVDALANARILMLVNYRPEVEHAVRVHDFENWLESAGRSPAEMILKTRLRQLLKK